MSDVQPALIADQQSGEEWSADDVAFHCRCGVRDWKKYGATGMVQCAKCGQLVTVRDPEPPTDEDVMPDAEDGQPTNGPDVDTGERLVELHGITMPFTSEILNPGSVGAWEVWTCIRCGWSAYTEFTPNEVFVFHADHCHRSPDSQEGEDHP